MEIFKKLEVNIAIINIYFEKFLAQFDAERSRNDEMIIPGAYTNVYIDIYMRSRGRFERIYIAIYSGETERVNGSCLA